MRWVLALPLLLATPALLPTAAAQAAEAGSCTLGPGVNLFGNDQCLFRCEAGQRITVEIIGAGAFYVQTVCYNIWYEGCGTFLGLTVGCTHTTQPSLSGSTAWCFASGIYVSAKCTAH